MEKRFWEVDLLRGIAVVLMVIFHVVFIINFSQSHEFLNDYWLLVGRPASFLFVFLAGISLSISHERAKKQNKTAFKKYLFRGLRIFSYGLLITLVTWIFLREMFVVFGALHLIGLSIIIGYFFLNFRYLNFALGIFLMIFGFYLLNFTFNFSWLLWLGIVPKHFYTLDYFPLIPWFGLFIIGMFFGKELYSNYRRNFKIHDLSGFLPVKFFSFLGRHSLAIYFLHIPIILSFMYIFGFTSVFG